MIGKRRVVKAKTFISNIINKNHYQNIFYNNSTARIDERDKIMVKESELKMNRYFCL